MREVPTALSAALSARYRIERELGAGGMATVYLARDLKHERDVAIKVLRAEVASAVGVDRFLAEIKTTGHLKHPHILPLFDSGSADSLLFPTTSSSTAGRRTVVKSFFTPSGKAVSVMFSWCRRTAHARKR